MVNNKVKAKLDEMHEKYFDLVWIARRDPNDPSIPKAGREAIKRIEKQFPEEVARLDGFNPDWEHGFNSGMLAGLRFFLSCIEDQDIKQAMEEFPFLDS